MSCAASRLHSRPQTHRPRSCRSGVEVEPKEAPADALEAYHRPGRHSGISGPAAHGGPPARLAASEPHQLRAARRTRLRAIGHATAPLPAARALAPDARARRAFAGELPARRGGELAAEVAARGLPARQRRPALRARRRRARDAAQRLELLALS